MTNRLTLFFGLLAAFLSDPVSAATISLSVDAFGQNVLAVTNLPGAVDRDT